MRLRHFLQVAPSPTEVRHRPEELEVTFAPMEALSDGLGGLDVSRSKPLSEVAKGSYNYFAEGDVLLAKVTPCFENGKKAVAEGLANGIGFATSEVHVLRPDPERINTSYLRYLLSSEPFRAAGMRSMTGAGGLRRVSEAAIKDFIIPTGDLDTQKTIADFLDKETARIDQLIEKKQRLVELLGERVRASVASILTDATADAPTSRLGRFVTAICDGPFGSSLKSSHYVDAGVRVIRLQNIGVDEFLGDNAAYISEEHRASLGDHDVYPGDILVAGLGDDRRPVGRACVAPDALGPAIVKADCFRVRLNTQTFMHAFIAKYLSSPLASA